VKGLIILFALLYGIPISADYLNCPCKVVKATDGDTAHLLDQPTEKHSTEVIDIIFRIVGVN
jgi:hypothetical protein